MTDERYPLALPQGSVLAGQYIIEQVLGQGGFGITYQASDHKSGQKVAIKEFFPDTMATRTQTLVTAFAGERGESFAYGKACFLQEAETLAEFIGNENIVRVHSYFEENQTAYFVMDFVEGISFDNYIREQGGRIRYEEAERILLPVIDALAAVHHRGIVHRDVTPDNIYITKEGTVKLLDFGAARYSLGDKSRSLDVVLKHGFAPKEQYTRRGKQGAFTDVYTLGATFYFAITGRRPPDSIDRMEEDELIPPVNLGVSIPKSKEDAILQALSVQPAERFPSMEALKQALLGTETPEPDREEPPQEPPQKPQQLTVPQGQEKQKRLLWAGIGAGGAAAVVIIAAAAVLAIKAGMASNRDLAKAASYDVADHGDIEACAGTDIRNAVENSLRRIQADRQAGAQQEDADGIMEDNPPQDPLAAVIQGNTPDNIARYGQLASDGNSFALAYPGGNGLIYLDNSGDTRILDDTGYIRCISMIGDTIYYINTGEAYCVSRDGSKKERIPQLAGYDRIATLYVSNAYFYMFRNDGVGLYCISRRDGALLGTIPCNGSAGFTFLDGNLYYISANSPAQLYRIPADHFELQPELLLDEGELGACRELASEEGCVYGIYENESEAATSFFQYDVSNGEKSLQYNFPKAEWPGEFSSFSVVDHCIYFIYTDKDTGIGAVCRFKAETDAERDDAEIIYRSTDGQHLQYLSLLKNDQMIAVCTWGSYHELIIADMDGGGEPIVLDDKEIGSIENR